MMMRIRNERGLALVAAIVGLIVTGALVSAFVMASVLEHRQSTSTRRMVQAFAAAEHGLGETVGNWNSASWNVLAPGDSVVVQGSTPGGSGSYAGSVRRLNDELFLVDMTGRDASDAARQQIGSFVRLLTIDIDIAAALTTRGPTRVGGSARIDGVDASPFGWAGCPPDTSVAGLRIADLADLTTQGGCSGASCIYGDPPVEADSTISDSTFFRYGDLDWADLTAMATKPLAPGTYTQIQPSFVDNACNTADVKNWGDPLLPSSACGGYFPIMYSPGDLSLSQGYGQGMLLVEGSLSVQGGFQFFGIVIVRQSLKTTGTGGHFYGAVMAGNVDLDQNLALGDALVEYSSCANKRVLTNATRAAMLRSRAWLYTY